MKLASYIFFSLILIACSSSYYSFDELAKSKLVESNIYKVHTGLDSILQGRENYSIAWVIEPIGGSVEGFVVLSGGVSYKCNLDYSYRTNGIKVEDSGCTKLDSRVTYTPNFFFSEFRSYAYYQAKHCGVDDGWSGIIDLASGGQRYQISWDNIDACDDQESKGVYAQLKNLMW